MAARGEHRTYAKNRKIYDCGEGITCLSNISARGSMLHDVRHHGIRAKYTLQSAKVQKVKNILISGGVCAQEKGVQSPGRSPKRGLAKGCGPRGPHSG